MIHYGNGNLEDMFGREVVDKLTNVYGDILGSIIQQRSYDAVPRHLRLTIAHALICEAERGETDSTYLKTRRSSRSRATTREP